MHRRLSLFVLALALAGCASAPPPAAIVPTLAGEWEPVVAEIGGKDFPIGGFTGSVLRLTVDTYEFGNDRGTYALPPGGPPAPIDVRGVDGPNAGRTIAGIYEFAGDKLTICYQLGNGDRPTAFQSTSGPRVLLVRYRRIP